mmetsp:Transcript_7480/g.11010  ORF Transcript_7480/g.11010 Transcript_7480/m.11010 type:complete len:82 (+) Transcript_7480:185-430(+)
MEAQPGKAAISRVIRRGMRRCFLHSEEREDNEIPTCVDPQLTQGKCAIATAHSCRSTPSLSSWARTPATCSNGVCFSSRRQ